MVMNITSTRANSLSSHQPKLGSAQNTEKTTPDSTPSAEPKDTVESGGIGSTLMTVAGGALVTIMGRRVPTLKRPISEESRQKVLHDIQPGDVLLETDLAYPGWERMEHYTLRSNYTHAAIYEGEGKFLEATTPGGVMRTDLDEYLHGPIKVAVIRPPYQDPDDVKAALNYARSQLGKEYDSSFDASDDSQIYCAELVRNALASTPHPIATPERKFFGRQAVAPDAFFKIEGAKVVYDDKAHYWKDRLYAAPVALATAAAATAGGMAFGTLGAIGGAVLGYTGSLMVGNYLQIGQFRLTEK